MTVQANSTDTAITDTTIDVDIAIVGGGIAGSALALALKDSGYKLCVIDPNPIAAKQPKLDYSVAGFDARVFALNLASMQFLRRLSAWPAIEASRCQHFSRMFVADGEGTGHCEMQSHEIGEQQLGAIVEHNLLHFSLLQALEHSMNLIKLASVTVERLVPEDMAGFNNRLILSDGRTVRTKLVVGADGGNSWVRQQGVFDTREWSYGHKAIVCTLACEKPHQNTAWQRFMHAGPLAFLPLPSDGDKHFVSIVWSQKYEEADMLLTLDDDAFMQRLQSVSEGWLGRLNEVSRRFSFDLRQRHAKSYAKEGIVLVADAAHTIHPLAGQGMNLGLEDVRVLSEELLTAKANSVSISILPFLSRYQRRRKADNLLMMAAMEGFKRLFEQESLVFGLLRKAGMDGFSHLPFVKQEVIKHAAGLR